VKRNELDFPLVRNSSLVIEAVFLGGLQTEKNLASLKPLPFQYWKEDPTD